MTQSRLSPEPLEDPAKGASTQSQSQVGRVLAYLCVRSVVNPPKGDIGSTSTNGTLETQVQVMGVIG